MHVQASISANVITAKELHLICKLFCVNEFIDFSQQRANRKHNRKKSNRISINIFPYAYKYMYIHITVMHEKIDDKVFENVVDQ